MNLSYSLSLHYFISQNEDNGNEIGTNMNNDIRAGSGIRDDRKMMKPRVSNFIIWEEVDSNQG